MQGYEFSKYIWKIPVAVAETTSSYEWGTDSNGDDIDDGPVPTGITIDYKYKHPGNLLRKGVEKRVRCVYSPEGIRLQ